MRDHVPHAAVRSTTWSRYVTHAAVAVAAAALSLLLIRSTSSDAPPGLPADADTARPTAAPVAALMAERQQVTMAAAPARGPVLRGSDTDFDWGTITAGGPLKHTFVLHNDGDKPLQIRKAKPNRSCAVVEFDHVIRPGGTGIFKVVIGTHALKPGRVRVAVDLETNERRGYGMLVLNGKVVAASAGNPPPPALLPATLLPIR